MKTQFDTELDAVQALGKARADNLGWCPIIKEPCKNNCICYYAGDIHHQEPKQFASSQKEYWFVHYPGCTNVLISGGITVES